jgi:hypothetical protein
LKAILTNAAVILCLVASQPPSAIGQISTTTPKPTADAGNISGGVYYLGIALNQAGEAGEWVHVGEQAGWKETTAGTVLKGKLYTTETSGNLSVTDAGSGIWRQLCQGRCQR